MTLGSSPLTRGTRHLILPRLILKRFIPAYAGNSVNSVVRNQRTTVHPRLRGELKFCSCGCGFNRGSSPLTRGTLHDLQTSARLFRFIPAYAGNSLLSDGTLLECSVHPRLRGELQSHGVGDYLKNGSSPLTRGTHLKTV